jgi:flagellar hook-length control protein FliK
MTTVGNISDTIAAVEMSKAIGKNSIGSEEEITTSFMNLMNGYTSGNNTFAAGNSENAGVITKDNASGDTTVFEESKTFSRVKSEKMIKSESSSDYKISEDDIKAVKAFEEKTADLIKEKLGVSDEELEEAMAELGFVYADLLDQSNLTSLMMKLTDANNIGELLTTDGVGDVMQGVAELVSNLAGELKLDDNLIKDFTGVISGEGLEGINPSVETENIVSQQPDENAFANVGEMTDEAESRNIVTESAVENDSAVSLQEMIPDENAIAVDENAIAVDEDVLANEMTAQNPMDRVVKTEDNNLKSESAPETEASDTAGIESEVLITSTEEETDNDGGAFSKESKGNLSDNENDFAKDFKSDILNAETRHDFNIADAHIENTNVRGTESAQATVSYVNTEDVISQIVTQARVINTENLSSVEMQLNPANLGRMILHVVSEDGHITAKLIAQNETVKEALQTQLAELRVNLNQQGVKVDAVEVTVSSHEFEENLEGQFTHQENGERDEKNGYGERRTLSASDLEDDGVDLSESERLAANIMRDNGNSMDMHA